MPATQQQQAVLNHDPSMNGRVIAGPGTGKSWTSVGLAQRLKEEDRERRIGILTFTRAATAELLKKIGVAELDGVTPSTIHSFALSLLMRNPGASSLPMPLRLPDSYEMGLIHADLARQLRGRGFPKVTTKTVKSLEQEMASRWEALDPERVLLSSIDPALRNTYLGLWERHRQKFGYSLLAELPFRAGNAIEDFDVDLGGLAFLIVDEYQDLNLADIRLIKLIESKGVKVLALGDDDQSIYSFRMAAPQGIRSFCQDFAPSADYALTVSMRCGSKILDAANGVIEQAVDRPRRDPLTPGEGCGQGRCEYVRFKDQQAEIEGVAEIIGDRVRAGVEPSDIAVLVRTQVRYWSKQLVPALRLQGVEAIDTEWVKEAMDDRELRRGLALVRLALNREDSLAWWSLFELTSGISVEFFDYVCGASQGGERFGATVLRLAPGFEGAPKGKSKDVAAKLIERVLKEIEQMDLDDASLGEMGWGGWLLARLDQGKLKEEAYRLLTEVGQEIPAEEGLEGFLSQLEPVAKDVSLRSDGVRIMSMMGSKGLTVNTCIIMGVEKGLVPFPKGELEEERRLLYVATTRATEMCVMTFAGKRIGPMARSGTPNVNQPRGRCPFLEGLPQGNYTGGAAYIERLKNRRDGTLTLMDPLGPPGGAKSVPL